MKLNRKLNMGMVGGGQDAFIGAVHRRAALMDGQVEFIAGALSSSAEKSLASARDLLLSEDRAYASWQEMIEKETKRPEGERIDFVSIVTPNYMHFPIAKAFAEARNQCNLRQTDDLHFGGSQGTWCHSSSEPGWYLRLHTIIPDIPW